MKIPEEAINAAKSVLNRSQYIPVTLVHEALTAAAPHMSGVKVKQLDWVSGVVDVATPLPGMRYVACSSLREKTWSWWLEHAPETRSVCDTEADAKAAAQADYEKRILSAIEPSSAREQALDLSVLERLAKIADEYDEPDENGPFPDIQDAMISIRDLRQIRKLLAALRALKSHPSQVEQWRIIETAPDNTKGPFLVTNNPKALDAFGRPSHVWCVNGIYKDENGSFCAYEGNQKIYGLTMFMQVPAPQTGGGE